MIHNPAPGPWSGWPTHWVEAVQPVAGFNGVMTRACPHGFLHPCAEDVINYGAQEPETDHGCDGCPCGPEHLGVRMNELPPAFNEERGVARAKAILGTGQEDLSVPRDYTGQPAKRPEDLSLREKFLADQGEAGAEDLLSNMIHYLMSMVIAKGGSHPGRAAVPTPWLEQMEQLEPHQVKLLLQYACWHLAEAFLVNMEHAGALEQMYGIRLGKGFRHDDHE